MFVKFVLPIELKDESKNLIFKTSNENYHVSAIGDTIELCKMEYEATVINRAWELSLDSESVTIYLAAKNPPNKAAYDYMLQHLLDRGWKDDTEVE